MSASFSNSLEVGQEIEKIALSMIKKKYPKAVQVKGRFSEFDIWIPEVSEGIEVKYDRQADITGNVFIEVKMWGKPSGLALTRAHLWCYVTDSKIVWITPTQIANCIRRYEINPKVFNNLGGGENIGYLIPMGMMVEFKMKLTTKDKRK
jgi:hypothetical protein